MHFLLKLFLIILFQIHSRQVIALALNCGDAFLLSQNCTCTISAIKNGIQTMTCNGAYLTNATQNTLPAINTTTVPRAIQIFNTYTMFPTVPVSYLSLPNFNLNHNQISSIGDISNLANTLTFYMSYNLLTQLPSLCMLTKCEAMDFSYNLLQTIYFENFVCDTNTSVLNTSSNYVFSNLLKLSLAGNLIKVNIGFFFYFLFQSSDVSV